MAQPVQVDGPELFVEDRRGSPTGNRSPQVYRYPTAYRPIKVDHPGEISMEVLHGKDNDWDEGNNHNNNIKKKIEVSS